MDSHAMCSSKKSVLKCHKDIVTVLGESWMSDQCRFDDVNSLALEKPIKMLVAKEFIRTCFA